MLRSFVSLSLLLFWLSGCTFTTPQPSSNDTKTRLTTLLSSLDSRTPQAESYRLASDIICRSAALEQAFDRTENPYFHNFLVNIGVKKQGLCYHFSDGLYTYLIQGHYPHFAFHLAGAHIREYWREHNTLVVTAKGQPFEEGIVVDPWRKQGQVFVSRLKDDRAYVWKHRKWREVKTADRSCQ